MDKKCVNDLIAAGSSAVSLAQAQKKAKKAWPPFPHNGCAANLSALVTTQPHFEA